ncbi:MAG: hypothetical protein ACRYFX_31790 [Janthinobacterium lividum]
MHTVLTALTSHAHQPVRAAVAQLALLPLAPAHLALCAWVWHRWKPPVPTEYYYDSNIFQANRLGWRQMDDPSAGEEVRAALAELLQQQLPKQWKVLLRAASLFNCAYPEDVYEGGNSQVGGYVAHCRQHWRDFERFKDWFEQALPLAETLVCEWITVAQVFWNHYRWQPDNWFYGTFSEPACAYLLAKAITLDCAYPIQYYYFYKEQPHYEGEDRVDGQELALQSGRGLTYFFYAQFCQYHRQELGEALTYYRRFLELEPDCLPDNRFHIYSRDATKRSYPPSTQEALTEIGNIGLLQQQPAAARQAFEQAVALRPESVQAPYERLAHLARQQGDLPATLRYLARKAQVCAQARVERGHGYQSVGVGAYFCYDPTNPAPQPLDTAPSGYSYSDPAARVRVERIAEIYKQLADTFFYELYDYRQASIYYKKYLAYPRHYLRYTATGEAGQLEAAESQIRLAMEMGDYWQARSLCEKLLRTAPHNKVAYQYLGHVRKRLG